MQAVILAAGVSRRLRPLTDNTPKCLLDISGKNLLHRTVENVVENGITEFIFVTGYLENMIKVYLNENFPELKMTFITNPGYVINNNSYSLWMTREFIKDDILLLDSDILFDKKIIGSLLESSHENCLAVNFTKDLDEEQIKVILDDKLRVLEIGKEISIARSAGESIGIEKFSSYFLKELFLILERKITKENIISEFYEASFQEIIDNTNSAGSDETDHANDIYAVDISIFECMEIDTVSDYEKAQSINLKNE